MIPEEAKKYVLQILEAEAEEVRDFRRDYTRYLTELYLKYVAPHECPYSDFVRSVQKFMSCGRCEQKVWAYFREMYK